MQEIEVANCPACGHPLEAHQGRHCRACEQDGESCGVLEPGVESPGG